MEGEPMLNNASNASDQSVSLVASTKIGGQSPVLLQNEDYVDDKSSAHVRAGRKGPSVLCSSGKLALRQQARRRRRNTSIAAGNTPLITRVTMKATPAPPINPPHIKPSMETLCMQYSEKNTIGKSDMCDSDEKMVFETHQDNHVAKPCPSVTKPIEVVQPADRKIVLRSDRLPQNTCAPSVVRSSNRLAASTSSACSASGTVTTSLNCTTAAVAPENSNTSLTAVAANRTLKVHPPQVSPSSRESSCSTMTTMQSYLSKIPGFKPRKRSQRKLSAAVQLAQTKEGNIDLETPDSILVGVNVKALINKDSFASLPTEYQDRLSQLLPTFDRIRILENKNISRSFGNCLNNEFLARACESWRMRLSDGEFTHDSQIKLKGELEKGRSRLDPWKLVHFEPVWGLEQEENPSTPGEALEDIVAPESLSELCSKFTPKHVEQLQKILKSVPVKYPSSAQPDLSDWSSKVADSHQEVQKRKFQQSPMDTKRLCKDGSPKSPEIIDEVVTIEADESLSPAMVTLDDPQESHDLDQDESHILGDQQQLHVLDEHEHEFHSRDTNTIVLLDDSDTASSTEENCPQNVESEDHRQLQNFEKISPDQLEEPEDFDQNDSVDESIQQEFAESLFQDNLEETQIIEQLPDPIQLSPETKNQYDYLPEEKEMEEQSHSLSDDRVCTTDNFIPTYPCATSQHPPRAASVPVYCTAVGIVVQRPNSVIPYVQSMSTPEYFDNEVAFSYHNEEKSEEMQHDEVVDDKDESAQQAEQAQETFADASPSMFDQQHTSGEHWQTPDEQHFSGDLPETASESIQAQQDQKSESAFMPSPEQSQENFHKSSEIAQLQEEPTDHKPAQPVYMQCEEEIAHFQTTNNNPIPDSTNLQQNCDNTVQMYQGTPYFYKQTNFPQGMTQGDQCPTQPFLPPSTRSHKHDKDTKLHSRVEPTSLRNKEDNCSCNRQAMIMCMKCGAFCHYDCISSTRLCVICFVG